MSVSSRGLVSRVLEASRFLVTIGATASLGLAAVSFGWAVAKGVAFVGALLDADRSDDEALVKLFESVDTVLVGTVLLTIGLGLWELFVGDLDLPPALTTTSFDDLKVKTATTLLLVLVVRFLEVLVSQPPGLEILYTAIAVTLVGALLLVYARWTH